MLHLKFDVIEISTRCHRGEFFHHFLYDVYSLGQLFVQNFNKIQQIFMQIGRNWLDWNVRCCLNGKNSLKLIFSFVDKILMSCSNIFLFLLMQNENFKIYKRNEKETETLIIVGIYEKGNFLNKEKKKFSVVKQKWIREGECRLWKDWVRSRMRMTGLMKKSCEKR